MATILDFDPCAYGISPDPPTQVIDPPPRFLAASNPEASLTPGTSPQINAEALRGIQKPEHPCCSLVRELRVASTAGQLRRRPCMPIQPVSIPR